MSGAYSRRRPWPHDAELDCQDGSGWHGLMLTPTQEGLLVAKKEQSLAGVSPTTYDYGSQDPAKETTFTFARLVGGMGEKVQSGGASPRYRYATGIDCSIGGMPRLGPLFTDETFPGLPSEPGHMEVRQFVALAQVTAVRWFALVGRCVYERVAGVWTLSKDFGAGNWVYQAAAFQGTTGPAGLWVTTANGELWNYSGAAWALSTLASATFYVAAVQGQLWVAGFSDVKVASASPLVAASFGGAIQIGETAAHITWLAPVGEVMYVFKEDGPYATETTGTGVIAHQLFPEMASYQLRTNGKNATAWRDRLWFPWGDAAYDTLSPAGDLEPVGPDRLVDNDSPVRGRPVSGVGFADWFHYLVVYNATTGDSHLLKYGTWTNTDASAGYEFADAWHGALASWAGKRATRIDVALGAANPVLWVGFSDGSVAWATLPALGPDPAADPACRFVSSGRIYWPLHHGGYESTPKAYHGVTAFGPVLGAGQSVRQVYRTDLAAPYLDAGAAFTASGQRVELPDNTTGVVIDTATDLRTTDATLTPVLEGMGLHEAIRPVSAAPPGIRLEWNLVANAGNHVARRDGTRSRLTAVQVRDLLRRAAARPGHVRLRLPDESVGSFAQITYSETLAPNEKRHGLEHNLSCSFVQFK